MQRKTTCETSGNALTMESRGRQRERGKSPGNCSKSRKGRSKSILRNIEYWNCGKRWHLKKDCRDSKKKGDGHQETTQEENVVGDVLQDDLVLALDNTSDYWVVYLGDSCHATPHSKFFHDYVLGDFGPILLGIMNHVKLLEWVKYGLS